VVAQAKLAVVMSQALRESVPTLVPIEALI
jgi:hypothetical protein